MSDDNKGNRSAAPSVLSEPLSRRKLLYAAPAFMTRKMFYSQAQCNKQMGQTTECSAFPKSS